MISPLSWHPWFAFYFKMFTDVWFLIDLVLNFRTGWIHEDGTVILNVRNIRKLYFKLWFWIDFLSIIPFDTILEYSQQVSGKHVDAVLLTRYLKNIRFAKILTILRVFRGSRLFRYSYKFEDISQG